MTVQKGAESTTLPHPADVEPGEAWILNIDGVEIVPGFKASVGWICYKFFGGTTKAIGDERITLVTRLVPAPRVIGNHDELDEAKRDTVIRDARGVVCSRDSMGNAWTSFTSLADQRSLIILPATVLWEPEA